MARDRNSVRKAVAIVSGVFIWIAALMQVLQSTGATGGPKSPDFSDQAVRNLTHALDVPTLKQFWVYKRHQLAVDTCVNLFTSGGLLGLAYCVLILKRVFKRWKGGDSDLPGFMTGCFFFGAILPSIQLLQSLGALTSADSISAWKTLPGNGLQSLYIAFALQRGSGIYLFSIQFLLVSIGLALASYLSIKTGELPARHAVMGYVTAAAGFLTFILEIIAFNAAQRASSITFGICLLLYGVVLLPIWTIWLGVELRRLKQDLKAQAAEGSNMEFGLTDVSKQ